MIFTIKYNCIKRYRSRVSDVSDRAAWQRILWAIRNGTWVFRGDGERLVMFGRLRVVLVGSKAITCWQQSRSLRDEDRGREWRGRHAGNGGM